MAKKNATQQGVLDTESEVVGSPNPRNDLMEQIAQNNILRMKDEHDQQGLEIDITDKEPKEVKEEVKEEVKSDKESQVDKETKANELKMLDESELANFMVKTKIDGNEETKSIADVIKAYQKDSSASRRLEEASNRAQELDRRELELAERETQLKEIQQQPAEKLSDKDADALYQEVVGSIYEGDEAKTVESLKKLMEAGRNVEHIATQNTNEDIDIEAITNKVRETIEMETSLKSFNSDYSDIMENKFLRNIADTYLEIELQDGTDFDLALKKAGNSTRAWVEEQAVAKGFSKPNNELKVTTDSKKADKDNLDDVRSTNTKLSADAEEQVQTVSDVVAEMRKARGLPA